MTGVVTIVPLTAFGTARTLPTIEGGLCLSLGALFEAADHEYAATVSRRCPALDVCTRWAFMQPRGGDGIIAGMTPSMRSRHRKRLRKEAKAIAEEEGIKVAEAEQRLLDAFVADAVTTARRANVHQANLARQDGAA